MFLPVWRDMLRKRAYWGSETVVSVVKKEVTIVTDIDQYKTVARIAQASHVQNAPIETCVFYENLYLKVNDPNIGTVVTLCKRLGGKVVDIKYDPDPVVQMQIRQRTLETFRSQLQGYGIVT